MGERRVLGAAAVASLVVFAALTAFVTHHGFDATDEVARALVHRPELALLRPCMEAVSFAGGKPGQIVVVTLAFGLLWQRWRRWSVALPLVMIGAGLLEGTLKWAVDRPRPNLDPWGFPSGHVMSVVVLSGYLAYVVGSATRRMPACVALWATIVGTMAFSRMYLDAHWLSDVLGGFTVGLAYLLAALCAIGPIPRRRAVEPAPVVGEPLLAATASA